MGLWGTQSYKCINTVQNRAARYFLNVGRYTPNAAVNGDIGWIPIQIKCWKTVLSHWCRSVNMDATRLNRTIFLWSNVSLVTDVKIGIIELKICLMKPIVMIFVT